MLIVVFVILYIFGFYNAFYSYWVKTLIAHKSIGLNERAEKYNRQIKKMTDLGNRDSFEVLKNADVIAMTTTGAAKHRDMIYRLPVSFFLCYIEFVINSFQSNLVYYCSLLAVLFQLMLFMNYKSLMNIFLIMC